MALYRTLSPISYIDDGVVKHILKAGVLIDLDEDQAAALGGSVVYVTFSGTFEDVPHAQIISYPTASDFPFTGNSMLVYLAENTGRLYRWDDDDSEYVIISQTVAADDISDATAVGKALLRASSEAVAREVLDLETGIPGLTASASELNILDGATLSTTELNYVDGVTSAIQSQLDGKVDENSAITGATKTKITYDSKGLVTAGADATTADIADSSNKRYVTDAQLTVIGNTSGTNTGDQTLSDFGVTATASELNILDGATLSVTELNYVDGVTSAVQTQFDGKQPKIMTGTCATAQATAAKTVTLDSPWASHVPATGDWFWITYTNGVNANSVTLTINGTARAIRTPGAGTNNYATYTEPGAGQLYYYDGSFWRQIGLQLQLLEITQPQIVDSASASLAYMSGRRGEDLMVNEATKDRTLTNKIFIPKPESTVTSAGTKTLTIASPQVQVFTGSTTHTVDLPTTSVIAGMTYTVVNNSTQTVTVRSSAGNTIQFASSGRIVILEALIDTPTTNAHWQVVGMTLSESASGRTVAMRDNSANLTADNFIASRTSTATAAGTTTLTLDSTQTQVFTGSTTQNVDLPTTNVIAGQIYTIINTSSGNVTVRSSAGNSICIIGTGRTGMFLATIDTPTSSAHWFPYAPTTSALPNTIGLREGNGNLYAVNHPIFPASTATAGGTTTMTVASTGIQVFTGSSDQTVTLPTTSVSAGWPVVIINNSTGTITVNSSGGNLVASLAAGESVGVRALVDTPTTAAHWKATDGSAGGGGTPDDGTVTTAKFAASALVTSSEGLESSDNDLSVPTTAAS